MDGRAEYRKIVENLIGRLEYLLSSGITEVPVERGEPPEGGPAAKDPLEALSQEISGCRACGLRNWGARPVAGAGNPSPVIMFIGGCPTVEDEENGRPFSGNDGAQLERIIAWMSTKAGFEREEAYLCHAVKCRPASGKVPSAEEAGACKSLLERQIKALSPKVIVALGPVAAGLILGSPDVKGLRGRFHAFNGIKVMPTYDPAELLKKPALKKETETDMLMVIDEIKKDRQA
ncbi:MAG: uracil-DNA glycosylase [Deltaproteobacteria bacterium]|nr:uracil-DNA glycosylase [Deltaproteobacteria bacterium]MBI5903747.1 uracil-DNA glycosylase [Deltaproteobacteria bacterium]